MRRQSGTIISNMLKGEQIYFFVTDSSDVIQRHHARGQFYELDELRIISEFFPSGGVFVDIGANVGNHTIFVCKFLHPIEVIVFEPNPLAIAMLDINLSLNRLHHIVDSSSLGLGLSDETGFAVAVIPSGNLGGTRLRTINGAVGIRLITGDSALQGRRVDFVKLDVEAMELKALAGLCDTIAKWRPIIFVEVDDVNADEFLRWVQANGYSIARRFRRYPVNENYLLVPRDGEASRMEVALR
jgi:FkbM family methyltransferase